jgi:hypothetical protein
MPIELEFFTLTGPISDIVLKHPPSTGADNAFDVAVDPIGGPAQRLGADYGVTGSQFTGILTYNLVNSDIKSVRQQYQISGETGPILRVLYNYD